MKNDSNVFYKSDTFTVQIYNNSQTFKEKNDLQIKNKLSIVDFSKSALFGIKKVLQFYERCFILKNRLQP